MKYVKEVEYIKIFDKNDFNPQHILECGQVFCFSKKDNKFLVFPENKYAEIEEQEDCYIIKTEDVDYFENYFDLKRDYSLIKQKLSAFKLLEEPLKFGYGIRILNQNLFETLISFIISANNNIKRIKLILNNIRQNLGELQVKGNYSFPSYEKLKTCDEEFFKKMGAGYRAGYIVKVLKQITPKRLNELKLLDTQVLRKELIALSGVGPKVADCLLLFGFHRGDVFPVDTWIHKMYNSFYSTLDNREKIRNNLIKEFGLLSGYAQQYLFYYQRSYKE